MDALTTAATTIFSPAMLAAFGPLGAVALFLAWMVYLHLRGREERQARFLEEQQKSLRDDQRELFERQAREIEGLKVDKAATDARLRATEDLCGHLRRCAFDLYLLCRDNTHAAVNARQGLISAGLKTEADFQALNWPQIPPT